MRFRGQYRESFLSVDTIPTILPQSCVNKRPPNTIKMIPEQSYENSACRVMQPPTASNMQNTQHKQQHKTETT